MSRAWEDAVRILADMARSEGLISSRCHDAGRREFAEEYWIRSEAVRAVLVDLQSSHTAKADPGAFLGSRAGRAQLDADGHEREGHEGLAAECRIAATAIRSALVAVLRAGELRGASETAVNRRVDELACAAREEVARP